MANIDNLIRVCKKLQPYYDIDKIKAYTVYVWSKDSGYDKWDGKNVFDIFADRIQFYEEHSIPADALPIIDAIQHELKRIEEKAKGKTYYGI